MKIFRGKTCASMSIRSKVFQNTPPDTENEDLIALVTGNEDDYIIISLVRSEKIGFLANRRRVNVMLTRCKKGMIICTSRTFLEALAPKSLVGKLAAMYNDEPGVWLSHRDVLMGKV